MTAIHLDTSFLIRALVAGTAESTRLTRWLSDDRRLHMSIVAWSEFLCGPLDAEQCALARAIVGPPAPLDERAAELAAAMFNRSGRKRGSLSDCLIAATAVRAGAPLATSNPKDFTALTALGLEIA